MRIKPPKPSCYCKETAYDWDICHKCEYGSDCEYNACGYNEATDDYFLLYY